MEEPLCALFMWLYLSNKMLHPVAYVLPSSIPSFLMGFQRLLTNRELVDVAGLLSFLHDKLVFPRRTDVRFWSQSSRGFSCHSFIFCLSFFSSPLPLYLPLSERLTIQIRLRYYRGRVYTIDHVHIVSSFVLFLRWCIYIFCRSHKGILIIWFGAASLLTTFGIIG